MTETLRNEPKELWDIYDENRQKTGRLVERGSPMGRDEYHIAVSAWIRNPRGEWLISKRSPNKPFPLMWERTGGSALAGEESLDAALREAREEVGVELDPSAGLLFKSYIRPHCSDFMDVWLFSHDCPIERIVLQEGETCDAMWASGEEIKEMVANGEFLGYDVIPYLDEILDSKGDDRCR